MQELTSKQYRNIVDTLRFLKCNQLSEITTLRQEVIIVHSMIIRSVYCNAQMNARLIEKHVSLDNACMDIVRNAMKRFDMSARAYDRILKVARTIADLDGSEPILPMADNSSKGTGMIST